MRKPRREDSLGPGWRLLYGSVALVGVVIFSFRGLELWNRGAAHWVDLFLVLVWGYVAIGHLTTAWRGFRDKDMPRDGRRPGPASPPE